MASVRIDGDTLDNIKSIGAKYSITNAKFVELAAKYFLDNNLLMESKPIEVGKEEESISLKLNAVLGFIAVDSKLMESEERKVARGRVQSVLNKTK